MKPTFCEWVCAGTKVLVAMVLALITANAIASRISNCPSIYNPLLGRVPKPGAGFNWRVEGNGQGLWTANCVRRSKIPLPSSGTRLLVLGDSFVEGLQVDDAEHFAHILEKKLRLKDDDISVLALGKSGLSVADYVAKSKLYQELFSPHWVVIQVCDADLCDDAWNARKPAGNAYFKYIDASQDITVVAKAPENVGICGRVNDKIPYLLPLVSFAQDRNNIVQSWLRDSKQPWFHAEAEVLDTRGRSRSEMMNYPVGAELDLLADAYAKRVTILYLPPFDPTSPGTEAQNESILRSAAVRAGIHFVSLRNRFASLAAAGHAPYGFANTRFNHGHWNRHGHQAAADLLVEHWNQIQHAIH